MCSIGMQQPAVQVEPLEDPFRKSPAEPERPPVAVPEKEPEKEPVT